MRDDDQSSFWSRRACVRHTWWRTKRSWPLFSPTFFFSFFFFFFFFFFSAFYFSPTSGNLPCVKIFPPQYFGITRRYMQKKNFTTASVRSRSLDQPLVPGVFIKLTRPNSTVQTGAIFLVSYHLKKHSNLMNKWKTAWYVYYWYKSFYTANDSRTHD